MLLSQHVETRHTLDLVATGGFGYLLKDRVLDVDDFLDALRRVAAGGSALDPEVVAALVTGRRDDPLAALSPREREVLALMAEGRTNAGIARRLWLTDRTVETHVRSILGKLGPAGLRRGPPPGAGGAGPPARGRRARVSAPPRSPVPRSPRWRAARGAGRIAPTVTTTSEDPMTTGTPRIDVAPSRRAGAPWIALLLSRRRPAREPAPLGLVRARRPRDRRPPGPRRPRAGAARPSRRRRRPGRPADRHGRRRPRRRGAPDPGGLDHRRPSWGRPGRRYCRA